MGKEVIYDIVGIGFGPSNLALAVAIEESQALDNWIFLEKRANFSWHEDMLIKNSTMQTPFLKDIITFHNPCSRFTFLNFLKQKGRLTEFVSLREFFPSRIEFDQYFSWAADQISSHVQYNKHVTALLPKSLKENNCIDAIKVEVKDITNDTKEYFLARNVVLGMGSIPYIPDNCEIADSRVFHSEYFLSHLQKKFSDKNKPYSFSIIGAGQSAAEVVCHILEEHPVANVAIYSRGFIFHAIDENPLVNSFYSNKATEKFFQLEHDARKLLLSCLERSNFSAVDPQLIHKIAKIMYKQKVDSEIKLKMFPFYELREINKNNTSLSLNFHNKLLNKSETFSADRVCLATGYKDTHLLPLLKNFYPYFKVGNNDSYKVDLNYKIEATNELVAGIYLQGYSRESHGFVEGTIADLAGRAQSILQNTLNFGLKLSQVKQTNSKVVINV